MIGAMLRRLVVLSVAVLAVSGCQTSNPETRAPSSPSAPSLGETLPRESADELAENAVRDYLEVSAAIAATGGTDTRPLESLVSESWLPEELAGFAAIREMGVVFRGAPTIVKIEVTALAGITAVSEGTVHVCTALEGAAVVDDEGVALPVEPEFQRLSVSVVPRAGAFVVDAVEMWEDTSWCAQ